MKCATTTITCLPGSTITDIAAAGNCAVDDFMNPDCTSVVGKSIICPNASIPTVEKVCTPGIATVPGGDASSCNVCRDITFIGSCDLDAQGNSAPDAGRSVVTCPASTLQCTPDDIIDLADMGCTATNAVTAPGQLYWFNPSSPATALCAYRTAGVPLPTKIRCTDFLATSSCQYHVGAVAANGCSSDNSYATITIGTGPVANPDGELSLECPGVF